jgi:hypothetical protein
VLHRLALPAVALAVPSVVALAVPFAVPFATPSRGALTVPFGRAFAVPFPAPLTVPGVHPLRPSPRRPATSTAAHRRQPRSGMPGCRVGLASRIRRVPRTRHLLPTARMVGVRTRLCVALEHLLPIDAHLRGRFDTEFDLAAANREHGDAHVVTDDDGLTWLAGQNEHGASTLSLSMTMRVTRCHHRLCGSVLVAGTAARRTPGCGDAAGEHARH